MKRKIEFDYYKGRRWVNLPDYKVSFAFDDDEREAPKGLKEATKAALIRLDRKLGYTLSWSCGYSPGPVEGLELTTLFFERTKEIEVVVVNSPLGLSVEVTGPNQVAVTAYLDDLPYCSLDDQLRRLSIVAKAAACFLPFVKVAE